MKRNATLIILMLVVALPLSAQVMEGSSNTIVIDLVAPASKNANADLTLEALGISKLPKYHALIIGVSDYDNSGAALQDLEMPVKDAEQLYKLLTEKYAFAPENVTLLKNASREDIINSFDRLANVVGNKDNLLVFYAGHGYYDKSKDFGFWLPADAKTSSRSAWIANSTIKDYLGAIHSKHTLLITDACFGGSIFKTRAVSDVLRQFNEVYKDNSRKAMTSGNLSEVPDKSVFLKYLLKNLEENNDLFLSASKLYSRLYEPVLNNASAMPQFGVIQGAGDEGGDFIFIKKK